jgi:prepilin-type N-terminal cleavage/methylation domain-containing protein
VFSHPSSYRLQSFQFLLPRVPNLRGHRLENTDGFSLIELLVVILVIGVLAAISIPSFLNEHTKAVDVQAKSLARTAQSTAELIGDEHEGNYSNVNLEELHSQEPTIRITESPREAYVSAATGKEHEYSITTTATDGDELTVSRNAEGEVSRECISPVTKTGCGGSETSSW